MHFICGVKKIDVIPKIKSQDKSNRKKMPNDIKIPNLPSNKKDLKYIQEAIKYVDKYFPNNYGNTENFFIQYLIIPLNHGLKIL